VFYYHGDEGMRERGKKERGDEIYINEGRVVARTKTLSRQRSIWRI
jgi:hypothetical protein